MWSVREDMVVTTAQHQFPLLAIALIFVLCNQSKKKKEELSSSVYKVASIVSSKQAFSNFCCWLPYPTSY